jgi:hypothetical protein
VTERESEAGATATGAEVEGAGATGAEAEGAGAEGAGAEGAGAEDALEAGAGAAADPEAGPVPGVEADAEPTLVEEFGVLASDMRGTVIGSPRQRVTGLIFLVLLFFAAMLGLAALRDSGVLGSPASPSPSAGIVSVRIG